MAEVYALVVSGRCWRRMRAGREDRWCYSDEGKSFETGVGEKWVVTWVGLRLWRCRASAPED